MLQSDSAFIELQKIFFLDVMVEKLILSYIDSTNTIQPTLTGSLTIRRTIDWDMAQTRKMRKIVAIMVIMLNYLSYEMLVRKLAFMYTLTL